MVDKNQKIYDKFDHDVSWMIIHAKAASINAEIDCLYPESFILGILSTGENEVTSLLMKLNIDLEKCLKTFKKMLSDKKSKKTAEETTSYENLKKAKIIDEIIIASDKISVDWGHEVVNSQHIFLAILQLCPPIRKVFEDEGLNFSSFIGKIKKKKSKPQRSTTKTSSNTSSKSSALETFCVNMTEQASMNKYDPIISRENEIEEAITILCRRNKSNPILIGEPGVGKAQPLDSLILTKNGWKKMGDMKIGDIVITPEGKYSTVVGVFPQGTKDIYKVNFVDNRSLNVCGDHLWKVYGIKKENMTHKRLWSIEDTNTIINNISQKSKINRIKIPLIMDSVLDKFIPSIQQTNLVHESDLFISPYIMGALIGDGNFCNGSIRFSSSDKEIIDNITCNLDKNYQIKKITGSKYDYRITIINRSKNRSLKDKYHNKYYEEIHKLGLDHSHSCDKFIPSEYMHLSLENRYDLLRGLFDTDGYVCKNGSVSYSTSSSMLAASIQSLIWSIGGICSIKEQKKRYTYKGVKKQGLISYLLRIRIKNPECLFTLKRKLIRILNKNQYSKNLGLKIISIDKLDKRKAQCIKISDKQGLYISNDYIVTHNTAIVEGICQRIVSNTVPKKLIGCRIYSVDVSGMVAGTKYRGEFEKRLQDLLKELRDDDGAILFIDEIHNIIGAGSASGSVDAANMLKPALARYLKCIGATTNAEYKKYFSGDGALERRFERLDIDEPSDENVHKILSGIKPRLEEYHKCIITDDAINTSVNLTNRYIPERFFPDKAISCLDTACAKYAWEENDIDTPTISPHDIAMVISKQTKIPMEVILWDNFERIKNTQEALSSRVIGQDYAVDAICRTLKNAYSGVRNPDKPIGIFVFGGQTGTGKTYLAKELAKVLFSSETSFIKLDMSEYSEPHSVSKVTGSPPGYVGFNDVNIIADRIRRKPYCVLLLDETEKAHPDVMKLFLQVMSDGIFTDSVGNKVNCKNLILIMTGNFGMNSKNSLSIGFESKPNSEVKMEQEKLIQYCKDRFGAEFINRVDDFIPFVSLSEESLIKIAKLRLDDFVSRIHNKSCTIVFGEEVPKSIVDMSKKEHGMNANAINRIIEKDLETALADAFLKINEGEYTVSVNIKDGEFIVKSKKTRIKSNEPKTK